MQVIQNAIPETLADWNALPQAGLHTPEDTRAAFLCVLALYLKDKDTGINVLRGSRAMMLWQKGDQWFLWRYSSPLSGIRIPAAQDPWA